MPNIERLQQNLVDSLIKNNKRKSGLETPMSDGRFPSVDYSVYNYLSGRTGRVPINGSMLDHLFRLKELSIAYKVSGDAALEPDILTALRHWIESKYEFGGWWNIIGIPEHLGDTLILLMGSPLMKSEWWKAGLSLVERGSHFSDVRHSFITGQNLIWTMFNTIRFGILINKPEHIDFAIETWEKTVHIAPWGKEGIQVDYSFFQHGLMPYAGGYGCSFASSNIQLLELIANTGWSLSQDAIDALLHFLLDMQQHFMRRGYMDYSIMGRGPSEEGALLKTEFTDIIRRYAALPATPRTGEFTKWADRMEGKLPYSPLNRLYWKSEIMVNHTPECHLSVRGCSNRIMGTESGNKSQGLKNYHMADGTTCNMARGDEYYNIMPVWNWRRLPGLTAQQSDEPYPAIEWGQFAQGLTDISGGASDCAMGCFAFNYRKDRLGARKFTFMFPEAVDPDDGKRYPGGGVYMTAAVTSFTYDKRLIYTSAEQCLPGPGDSLPSGGISVAPGESVRCGELCYHILEGEAHAQIETQTGSWHSISSQQSDEVLSSPVFSLWFDHGRDPENEACAYAIAGGPDAASPRKWMLHNTYKIQAVFDGTAKIGGAMFYEPSQTLRLPCGASLSVSRPCALVFAQTEESLGITIGMPDATAGYVTLRYTPAGGQERTLTVDLPAEGMEGSSVSAVL